MFPRSILEVWEWDSIPSLSTDFTRNALARMEKLWQMGRYVAHAHFLVASGLVSSHLAVPPTLPFDAPISTECSTLEQRLCTLFAE